MPLFIRRIAMLLALIMLLGSIAACDSKSERPAAETDSPAPVSDASPAPPLEASPEVSAEPSQEPTPPSPSPAESPEDVWTPQPEDYDGAMEAALRLAGEDMWAINFIINLMMDGVYIFDEIDSGLEDYAVTVTEYADFNNLVSRLKAIYTSEDTSYQFFMYPLFGLPQVYDLDGVTYVYPHYFSNFESRINTESIEITELTEGAAAFGFEIYGNEFFSDGSLTMTLTSDGWRLDDSFYFYCLSRLDLLDIESATAWEDNPLLDTDQNVGSAKRFTGECMFFNIFINDMESSWDEDSVAAYLELEDEAFRYLEGQAALFGHELTCYSTDAEHALYLSTEMYVSGDPDDNYWFDLMLMDTAYGDVNGLLESLLLWADDPDYDNYGLVIVLNKQGRSYAIPHNLLYHVNGACYAERTVVYYSTDYDYEYVLTSSTIAHELLHLFGALDLYYPQDGDDIRKQIIAQYFPFELMHYVPYQVEGATVSAFTAFRVGWRNTLPDQLVMFQAKG